MYSNFSIDSFIRERITRRTESLFKNDLIRFDSELKKGIHNKKVLVIGGAGTIGSFFIKALLKYSVKSLVVVDINENGLTELVRDIRSSTDYNIPEHFITYPVNFGDPIFEKLFKKLGPFEIVANFAAHKHVRSEKDIFSIEAMIENNVFRAQKLLDLLLGFPPEHFFCVSTDKAANPVNIMGASKKLMEELIMSYSSKLSVTTARFANVAFSNGSLLSGFIERLQKNQPLSCPTGIRRFFVSPQESGELCLIACMLGDSSDIFFPKLIAEKEMIPFDQIALDLLHFLGLQADVCKTEEEARNKALVMAKDSVLYPVYFAESNTSGEKSYEEFFTEDEHLDLKTFESLGVVKNSPKRNVDELHEILSQLKQLFILNEVAKSDVVDALHDYLPSFQHIEKGRGLDQSM